MPINSKRKGKVGELEWVNFLKTKFGIDAKRSQQYKGTADSADVESDWDFIHWEVKRVQALNLHEAMAKAAEESDWKFPVVAHRKNGTEWLVTLRAEDLPRIAQCIEIHRNRAELDSVVKL